MDPGDQTMYLVFRMAEFGMQGGLGALKLTGAGTVYVAGLLASLGKAAGKVLFRNVRERSLVKHGEIDTTVFSFAAKDKEELTNIMKKNHINGYIVESKNIFKKKVDGSEVLNVFIKTSDVNRLQAVAGHLVSKAARIERTLEVPEKDKTIDLRHDDIPDKTRAEEFEVEEVATDQSIEDIEVDHEKSFDERLRDDIEKPRDNEPKEDRAPAQAKEEEPSLMEMGMLANEVTTYPFPEEGKSLGEAPSPVLPGARMTSRTIGKDQTQELRTDAQEVKPSDSAPPTLTRESAMPSVSSRNDAANKQPPVREGVASMLRFAKELRERDGRSTGVPVVEKGKER